MNSDSIEIEIKLNQLKKKCFVVGIKACQDVTDVLEMLKIKTITKIRAYILEQISKLRKPMTNYHIPQNALLKHKLVFSNVFIFAIGNFLFSLGDLILVYNFKFVIIIGVFSNSY